MGVVLEIVAPDVLVEVSLRFGGISQGLDRRRRYIEDLVSRNAGKLHFQSGGRFVVGQEAHVRSNVPGKRRAQANPRWRHVRALPR